MDESSTAVIEPPTRAHEASERKSQIAALEEHITERFKDRRVRVEIDTDTDTGDITHTDSMLLGLADPNQESPQWYLFESSYTADGPTTITVKPALNTTGETIQWTKGEDLPNLDDDKMTLLNDLVTSGRFADPENKRDIDRITPELSLLGRAKKSISRVLNRIPRPGEKRRWRKEMEPAINHMRTEKPER